MFFFTVFNGLLLLYAYIITPVKLLGDQNIPQYRPIGTHNCCDNIAFAESSHHQHMLKSHGMVLCCSLDGVVYSFLLYEFHWWKILIFWLWKHGDYEWFCESMTMTLSLVSLILFSDVRQATAILSCSIRIFFIILSQITQELLS